MFKRFQKLSTKSIKEASELTNSTLKLLHVVSPKRSLRFNVCFLDKIFRHGNRTPVSRQSYLKDPWEDNDYRPYGPGQLTNKGKRTMYELGRFIRQQYDDFLGDYFPGVIEAHTTCVDRTQCSLQLFLAGLYPPTDNLIWEPTLLWQPIPYRTAEQETDKLLQAFTNDSQYKAAYARYQKEIGIKQRYASLFSYVYRHSGKEIQSLDDIWLLYFKLLMQTEMGLALPSWTKKIFPSPFEELAALNYVHTCATPELRKLVLKRFTDKIVKDTYHKILNDGNVLIYIYSGHEMNLAHTLIALNSFRPPHIPQYGSCVILEVHLIKHEIYIKALYKRERDPHIELLELWKENPVDFRDFVTLISLNYQ